MKTTLLAVAAFISFGLSAQESLTFKPKVSPNKTYSMEITTKTDMEIDFDGDAEIKEKMKSSGVQFPMLMKIDTKMPIMMITSKANANKEIPAVLTYGQISSSQTMNGEVLPQQPSPISGMKVKGLYKGDINFEVQEVMGENVTDDIKQMLKTTMKNVIDNVHFPDKPLKIGESFTDESPLQMPIAGFGVMKMVVKTKYTLKSIQKTVALLDIAIDMTLAMDQESVDMQASGSGTGSGEFNISQNYLTKYNTTMNMDMAMKMQQGLSAKVKMKSETATETVIK